MGTDPNLVFSRRRAQWHPALPIQLESGEKLRIALAIAAPKDFSPVEYETVQEVLKELANHQSDRIELLPFVNPATSAAIDALLGKQPQKLNWL